MLCMASGIVIGVYAPALGEAIADFGDLYISFLKMCVIPIMMTAIISSIGSLFNKSGALRTISRMLVVYAGALALTGVLGMLLGGLFGPGTGLSDASRQVLGSLVHGSGGAASAAEHPQGMLAFLLGMIPPNIFAALLENNTLQILFFSVIVGVAVGMTRTRAGEGLLDMAEALFRAFQKAISWSMYALPFALLCMMAGQFSAFNAGMLPPLVKLIALFYVASLLLGGLALVLLAARLRQPLRIVAGALKPALILAFGTRNSIATVPSCMDALVQSLKLEARTVQLVVPFGMIICRYSMVLVYTLGIVFTAQLFDYTLQPFQWLLAMIGALLVSVAGAGSPAVISIGMLAMIADMLKLPADVTIIVLLAIQPLVDPAITAANVAVNCATAALIADKGGNHVHD